MPSWCEMKLVEALAAIQHELVCGEASEGDLRKIYDCAVYAGSALANYRENLATDGADRARFEVLSERDQALEGVCAALQKFVSYGYIQDKEQRELAVACLSTPGNGKKTAEFLREHVANIVTDVASHAPNEHIQKNIHMDARYRLSTLDQLDWRWCVKAWDTGYVSEEVLQELKTEGDTRLSMSRRTCSWLCKIRLITCSTRGCLKWSGKSRGKNHMTNLDICLAGG